MTNFIIKFRWLIIISCVVAGVVFATFIPGARTDPEIRNYVPEKLPSRVKTDIIEKEFGVQDMVILLFSDSSIISGADLNQIRNTDRAISRISGVSQHISPFTIKTIRGEQGMMTVEPLIGKIPADSSERKALIKRIEGNRLASGVVISSDLTTAAITATIGEGEGETRTLTNVDSVITANSGNAKVQTGGLPYIRKYIMKDVRRDALIIVPFALLIMLLILKLTLGEWRRVFMPFGVVVLSTSISMGLIPLLGWKISIITLLVPIIMVAVANNYGIYLAARHQEISKGWDGNSRDIITKLTGSLNMPILFSGLTTIAGILGLLTHSIIPARQVGILAAAGVTIALIMSLMLIPALLYIVDHKGIRKQKPNKSSKLFEKMLEKLSLLIIKHPGGILATSLALTILVSVGIVLLKIETNQENYFPSNHPVRAASKTINEKFGGSQTISVMVSGDIKSPQVLGAINDLTEKLDKQEGVGRVFSISQAVREMTKAIFQPEEEGYDRIPDSREGIAQLFELYNMSGDQGDFDQLMNTENSKAHLLIRLTDPTNKIINQVQATIKEAEKNFPAEITIGGYAIIMSDFAESIIKGQVSSLLFAIITVFLLLAIIFKSFRGGLIGTIPLAASILIVFGFMGLTGIALDAATALLSSIMIGVGVDFTIQYMWCFNNELRNGLDNKPATAKAIRTIGRSIIINAFSVMAGFSALMFSGFTSIRFFGYLVFISIGACLIGAIVVIPAFLLHFRPRFIEKDLSPKKNSKNEKKNVIIPVPSAAFSVSSTTT
jgi:predicted RND superfamily exporter protein